MYFSLDERIVLIGALILCCIPFTILIPFGNEYPVIKIPGKKYFLVLELSISVISNKFSSNLPIVKSTYCDLSKTSLNGQRI